MKSAITLVITALWTLSLSIHGQDFRALITGQVTDPSGAAVPEASITAMKSDTRQAFTAKSDSAGVYSLLYLLPGQYTVTVEAVGFQKTFYDNVSLETAQKLNLDVKLSVGALDRQVTVSASSDLLERIR